MLTVQQAMLIKVLRLDLGREYFEISDIFVGLFSRATAEDWKLSSEQYGRKLCREAEFTLKLNHYDLEP